MPFKRVEDLLRARIGLDPDSIGTTALQGAVRTRMGACGLSSTAAYVELLDTRESELGQLIEEIVVRETWFFREAPAFELLRQRCVAACPSAERPYRVLSIPCATGEEPYSIAIALLDAGVAPTHFEVHAVDVSTQALEAARRACYGKNAFRSDLGAHAHHFEAAPDGTLVRSKTRERVQFSQGNVLDPRLHAGRRFDAVFCRNLLIYLDADSRLAALRNLQRLLTDTGVLFSGHSEASQLITLGLRRVGEVGSFAFELPAADELGREAKPRAAPPARNAPKATQGRTRRAARVRPARAAAGAQPAVLRPLEDARSLADRGELMTARTRCEESIAAAPTADAYCLLGIIKAASGDAPGAALAFNKALYLDAQHYEALVHFALLRDNAGDRAAAEKLRARAQRAALRAPHKEGA